MVDATRAGAPHRSRRRAVAACAVVVLLLHAAFLGGLAGDLQVGAETQPSVPPMAVRTIDQEPAQAMLTEAKLAEANAAATLPPVEAKPAIEPTRPATARATPVRQRSARPDSASQSAAAPATRASAAGESRLAAAPFAMPEIGGPEAGNAPAEATVPSPGASAVASGDAAPSDANAKAAGVPPLLGAGESPPPTYRTRLPPAVTLRYEVRRGFLRGAGEIRWRPAGASYTLALDARIAGLTLLAQSSQGTVDADGLAPLRFVEQRARRPAQAANFQRDAGKVTFSGPAVEWPLLAGAQDRLTWMIQLAAIAAAEPQLLVEGGRISMMVIGSRGDAAVWIFRFVGQENVETANGTVHALKLVRDARLAYDTSAEIWLDPEHSYLPAHATLRNSAGQSDYDLLLERIEPAP